ncbi:cytochrome c3 family protein [Litoribrevibacter albus]|uniref:nitrite reductase (cytochrome; ammonia-forming) n=1 Tax=Litoribrevibacter albus TaxID=1473156 RepID=A0AA37WA87_9GAMM|nr:cytochrome c3 family protein [Litoribrevibacter albus]GLQ33416.1 NrfA- nitrite reduction protein [Litoribrevibacter albus]
MKKWLWIFWVLITLSVTGFYGYKMTLDEDKSELLIGDATHGHFQIELACESCHTEPFGGQEVIQTACTNCHQQELKDAHDSHPKKKFTDPRNADLLQVIDARYCVSCHTEHQEEQTQDMGLTLPTDYCFHCHQSVGEERPSHKDLPFDSCASSGCHNYHDNKALYESFLVANSGGEWIKHLDEINANRPAPNAAASIAPELIAPELIASKFIASKLIASESAVTEKASSAINALFAEKMAEHPDINNHWQASAHEQAGMSCGGCHLTGASTNEQTSLAAAWIEKPGVEQCQSCHQKEAKGFLEGKHGMKLAQGYIAKISEMSSEHSGLSFSELVQDNQHGCNSCHGAHSFDTKYAATEACLSCHTDEHSQNFNTSPHALLKDNVLEGSLAAASQVTCATCHLPRVKEKQAGTEVVRVEHNQNLNLRPNEKMIRSVCMDCHNLEFSIDALADETLIQSNFNGKPGKHIESIDWALKRDQKKAKKE